MSNPTHYLWIDLETTGGYQDSNVEILELGAIVTPVDDLEEITTFHRLYRPSIAGASQLLENKVVREMHTKNGLIDDVYSKYHPTAEKNIIQDLTHFLTRIIKNGTNNTYQMAGSGIAIFDIPLLKELGLGLPGKYHWSPKFTYSCWDIGHIRRTLEKANRSDLIPSSKNNITHRALQDCLDNIEFAKYYLKMFSNL